MTVIIKGGTVVNATGRYLADVFADPPQELGSTNANDL